MKWDKGKEVGVENTVGEGREKRVDRNRNLEFRKELLP